MIKKPLLAGKVDLDNINYPVLATPKLDGIRCLLVDGVPLSRTFKPIPNKYITKILAGLTGVHDAFDGELMLKDPDATFQQVTSAVMSQEGAPAFVYCVFDYIGGVHGDRFNHNHPYEERVQEMIDAWKTLGKPHYLRPVIPSKIEDPQHLNAYERGCLKSGYEGIMIRDPKGIYKFGRSTTKEGILLKLKRFEDGEARIIGFEEKQVNQNEQTRNELGYAKRSTRKEGMVLDGTLGNFVVMDVNSNVEFRLGSGLNDSLRAQVWANKFNYLDKIIKYKFQAIGVKDAPRTPIFLGFRDPIDL